MYQRTRARLGTAITLTAAVAAALVTTPQAEAQTTPRYRVIDQGILPGISASRSAAFGVNNCGAVTGESGGTGPQTAYFWLYNPLYGYTDSFTMKTLMVSGTTTPSRGAGINSAGQIAGNGRLTGSSTVDRPMVWTLSSGAATAAAIPLLSGGDKGKALAINNSNPAVVVGWSTGDTGSPCFFGTLPFRDVLTGGSPTNPGRARAARRPRQQHREGDQQ